MRPASWIVLLGCAVLGLRGAETGEIQTVYLFPMSNAMDQYIANRLAATGLFKIVTDAKRADGVITGQIGATFEHRLEDLLAPPAPPPAKSEPSPNPEASAKAQPSTKPEPSAKPEPSPKPEPSTKHEPSAKHEQKSAEKSEDRAPSGPGDTVNKLEEAGRYSTWGRGKGTVFLVDTKTRLVVWSTFEQLKNLTPLELDRAAGRIVERLKKDLSPKQP